MLRASVAGEGSVPDESDRWAWLGQFLGVLAVVSTFGSWLPSLSLPLGNDHFGRILGRFALQADNFLEKGWVGSNWITDWTPYSSAGYSHHPPLGNLLHAALAWMSGGADEPMLRTVGFVFGLAAVVGMYFAIVKLTGSHFAAGVGALALALSGSFWVFGRLGLGFAVFLWFAGFWAERREASTGILVALGSLGAVAALMSWEVAAAIGLLSLTGLLQADQRRASFAGLVGLAMGAVLTFAWIEGANGISAVASHLEDRVEAADYGVWEWLRRQLTFYLRFESLFVLVLTVVGAVFALADQRLRWVYGAFAIMTGFFAAAFFQNAWIHEYWNWKASHLFAMGLAAMALAIQERTPHPGERVVAATAAFAVVFAVGLLAARFGGPVYGSQFVDSSAAGELAARVEYPEDQDRAWFVGNIPAPRWLAWYSGLPVGGVRLDAIGESSAPGPDDLVLVRRHWSDGLDSIEPLDSIGDFAYFTVEQLVDRP